MKKLFFLLAVTLVASAGEVSTASGNVILTQILWRHGARTPINPFPTDAYLDNWPDGMGQLTNAGKQQHYELGIYLRQRYSGFLNSTYIFSEILVNSTNVDRTLMSAYSDLSGLYPPEGDQVWNPDIPWQPIPVHTLPSAIDYILDTDSYCPKYEKEYDAVLASPQMQQVNAENADLFATVTAQSGSNITDVFQLSDVYDTIFIEKQNNLTTPSWAEPLYPQMQNLSYLSFGWRYITLEEQRLKGGPMLGHMIDNFHKRINGVDTARKAYIFSSHDTSVAAFLMALNIFNYIAPPYACAVIVDLIEMTPGDYGVQVSNDYEKMALASQLLHCSLVELFISYRNDTTVDPYVLAIPNCSSLCPIEQFEMLTSGLIPVSIVQECEVKPEFFAQFPWTVTIGLILIAALLSSCVLIGCYCWRKQRNNNYRYVMVQSE